MAGLYLEHHTEIPKTTVVLTLALPVALYLLVVYLLHTLLLSAADRFHLLLIALTLAILLAGFLLAVTGAPLAVCLIVVMLAPFVTVIGYETFGREHQRRMLEGIGVG
ncbi:hypothetical protein STANM309S_06234 [Streptomyces tanashiensis]